MTRIVTRIGNNSNTAAAYLRECDEDIAKQGNGMEILVKNDNDDVSTEKYDED